MPRILVVDDEPDICQMIQRYAEHDGPWTRNREGDCRDPQRGMRY